MASSAPLARPLRQRDPVGVIVTSTSWTSRPAYLKKKKTPKRKKGPREQGEATEADLAAEEPTGKATSREQGEATEAGLTAGEPTGKGEGTMPPKAPPVKREAVLPEPEGPASPLTAPKGTPEREGLQPAPKTKAPVLQGASGRAAADPGITLVDLSESEVEDDVVKLREYLGSHVGEPPLAVTEGLLFNGLLPLATEQYNKWGYVFQQIVTNNATTSLRELLQTPTKERGKAGLALCVTTFQRTAQLMAALPVNLCITWALRRIVTWVIIDFNADDEVMDLMSRHFGLAFPWATSSFSG